MFVEREGYVEREACVCVCEEREGVCIEREEGVWGEREKGVCVEREEREREESLQKSAMITALVQNAKPKYIWRKERRLKAKRLGG